MITIPSIPLRNLGGPIIAMLWVFVSMAELYWRDSAMWHSGAGALQSALSAAILLWPVTVGFSAATTVRPMRPGLRDIVQSNPDLARVRLIFKPLVALTKWALGGLSISALLCIGIAGMGGSWATWTTYLALLPTAAGTIAAIAVGGMFGLLLPYWVIPPTVAVGTYLAYLLPFSASQIMTAYVSASSDAILTPDPPVLMLITLVHLLWAAWAIAVSVTRLTSSRRFGALALTLGACWAVVIVAIGANQEWYQPLPESEWACSALPDSGRELCLPGEQVRDLSAATASLAQIDARVGESFPAGATWRYGPVEQGLRTLLVPVPFGDLENFPAHAAESIASSVTYCAALAENPLTEFEDAADFQTFYGYVAFLQDQDNLQMSDQNFPALSKIEAQALAAKAVKGCSGQ